jgi:hypothetical protein
MYSVNVLIIQGYELKVAKGSPSIKLNEGGKGLTFFSPQNFELHVIKNDRVHGVVTPGGGN